MMANEADAGAVYQDSFVPKVRVPTTCQVLLGSISE